MGVSLEHAQFPAVRCIPTRCLLTLCTRVPVLIQRHKRGFQDQFVNKKGFVESYCHSLGKYMSVFLKLDVTHRQPLII